MIRALALLLVLASCTAATDESTDVPGLDQASEPRPALLHRPSDIERRVLADVVAAALDRERVLLADDALVNSSELIIERQPKRSIDGLAQGYRQDMPIRFTLMVQDGTCFLERAGTGGRLPLSNVTCIPSDR